MMEWDAKTGEVYPPKNGAEIKQRLFGDGFAELFQGLGAFLRGKGK